MREKIELDLDAIEAAAKAATPQDFVSAQVGGAEEGWMECPGCGGEGSVELTADYLNYDGVALGVQFYGIGDPHVHAEAHYREARPAIVVAMVEEIRNLRRALGGMLFAFDDGVGQEWSRDLLEYARQVTPAVEYKPDLLLIQPLQVERDEYGFWTHPAWPSTDDELIPYSWFDERGLDIKQVDFEYDASETLQAAWYHDGTADCTAWNPSQPAGDGWFIFSIHDTEDGPICVWVRHKVGA